jgi:two-component system cell cycle response regulator
MPAHVLVVEDDDASRYLISYLLRAHQHEVSEASDGSVVIQLAREKSPALIVMDVHMPNVDGYLAVRALKADAELRTIPVLAITALAMVGDKEKVLAAGFDSYLSKPIEPADLIDRVDQLLRTRRDRRKVLVVDNMAASGASVRDALGDIDVDVDIDVAADVDTAFASARTVQPDLILCDLNLPSASGFDLLRQVRADALLHDVRFVLLTSSPIDDDDAERASEEGADALVERPLHADWLKQLVADHLGA